MPEGSQLLYGSAEPRHRSAPRRRSREPIGSGWPAPYWFEDYAAVTANGGSLIVSGTESWIIRYPRLMRDHLEGRKLELVPDSHLLRFASDPVSLLDVRRLHEDGCAELEDASQIWVAPSAPWAALDCARQAWETHNEPGPWNNEGARWRYCPDQELLYWTDGAGVDRVAVRASATPIDF